MRGSLGLGLDINLVGGRGGGGLGPELVPGTSSTLMRKADWLIFGEDATHIITDVAGGIRFQSDTTSPALDMRVVGILTVGKTYRTIISGVITTSGSTKTDCGILDSIATIRNGTFEDIADLLDFNITRQVAGVDMIIGAVSIREVL